MHHQTNMTTKEGMSGNMTTKEGLGGHMPRSDHSNYQQKVRQGGVPPSNREEDSIDLLMGRADDFVSKLVDEEPKVSTGYLNIIFKCKYFVFIEFIHKY